MFSFKNIYNCYLACRKHKRNSANQLAFEKDLIANLWQLKYDLDDKSYTIGKSICFLTACRSECPTPTNIYDEINFIFGMIVLLELKLMSESETPTYGYL
jgi:hypothetical protein